MKFSIALIMGMTTSLAAANEPDWSTYEFGVEPLEGWQEEASDQTKMLLEYPESAMFDWGTPYKAHHAATAIFGDEIIGTGYIARFSVSAQDNFDDDTDDKAWVAVFNHDGTLYGVTNGEAPYLYVPGSNSLIFSPIEGVLEPLAE